MSKERCGGSRGFRGNTVLPGILLLGLALSLPVHSRPSAGSFDRTDRSVEADFRKEYVQLLMEKGICDASGREIESRLSDLFREARSSGIEEIAEISAFVLRKLNYSEENLAGFPQCAFDRPVGFKLKDFGRTKAAGTIDAKAEGSACPVGGIGAGSFERTMSGNFRYWFLKLGWMVDETLWADQFHVFAKKGDRIWTQTMSTDSPENPDVLSAWQWRYPEGEGSYYALFPKSGFSYERNSTLPVDLSVIQFSPIIPHNYRETSFPVAVFKWTAGNPNDSPVEVSIMLTWENMVGWEPALQNASIRPSDFTWKKNTGGCTNQVVHKDGITGIVFKNGNMTPRTGGALAGTMCIAAQALPGKAEIFYHADFDPSGDGSEVWSPFSSDGSLSNSGASRTGRGEDSLAAAIAVRMTLDPGETIEYPLVVAWDFPYYEFEDGVKYRKKYTEFFGDGGDSAFAIACEGLARCREWEAAIDDWQAPLIRNPRLPDWLKQALFNELYILAETSIWDASTDLHTYLESVDYLMYGTFDVDAYSSWHLLKLWPELELNNMRFFAQTVDWEDPAYKTYLYASAEPGEVPEEKLSYYWAANKVRGMIPHDIGSPRKRPWVILNAFDWQNGNVWKDLNPKFPLRAYRDFLHTGADDFEFLKTMFTTSVKALDTLERRFADPDSHVPLNEGIPDQTYDTWKMKGESAFVTVLWLAALKTTSQMGTDLTAQGISSVDGIDVQEAVRRYDGWFESGRSALQKLWDEEAGYFHIDAHTDDIMTDQLFGLWYTKILGLEKAQPIMDGTRAERSLRTVFENNVLGYGRGLMGAVNGRSALGKQLFSQQGDEVWTGTSYAFASNCLLHGMIEEGLHTAYGVYHVVYTPFGQGYFFKTPEAYCNPEEFFWNDPERKYGDKLFRAMKYMRPGAVWAVYEALVQDNGGHEN